MNCLHCGKQLALFKKLREDAFCSVEHRDAFIEASQRLSVERLKSSSARLKARRYALLHPPADPEPVFCGFLTQLISFEAHDWKALVQRVAEWGSFASAAHPPPLRHCVSATGLTSGLIASASLGVATSSPAFSRTAVWPITWNAEIAHLRSGCAGQAELRMAVALRARGMRPASSETTAMERAEGSLQASSTLLIPSFDAAAPEKEPSTAARILDPGPSAAADHRASSAPAADSAGATLIEQSVEASLPAAGAAAGANGLAPELVSRLFRARPRPAVGDNATPGMHSLTPQPEAVPGQPAMVPAGFEPRSRAPRTSRWLDGRSVAVDARTSGMKKAGVESVAGKSGAPSMQQTGLGQTLLEPSHADRFFRVRPPRPVQGLSVPGWEPIESASLTWQIPAPPLDSVSPGYQPSTPEPELLDRVYRMRPKGPVPDRTPMSEPQARRTPQPESIAFSGAAAVPAIASAGVQSEPAVAEQLYGPLAGEGALDGAVQPFLGIAPEPDTFTAATAFQLLPGVTRRHSAPNLQPHAGQMALDAPEQGMADPALSSSCPIDAGALAATCPAPERPGLELAAGAPCEPVIAEQLYGPLAGEGALGGAAQPFLGIAPEPAVSTAPTALRSLPGVTAGPSAPNFQPHAVQIVWHPPEQGMADSALSSSCPIDAGAPAATSPAPERPALDAPAGASCEPAFLQRLFRARPRVAVADPSVAPSLPACASTLESASEAIVHPALAAPAPQPLAPNVLGRLFRFRPRWGVSSGLTTSGIEPRVDDVIKPPTVLPEAPAALLAGEPAPVERLFRPRPRGAIADPAMPAYQAIEAGAGEAPRIAMVFPQLPVVLMRQNRAVKDKPIRMRPRPSTQGMGEEAVQFAEPRGARQVS